MTRCNPELDVLLSLRAVGGLDAAEVARVDAHLERCERCRARSAADAEVLGLAKLAPMTEVEERAAAVRPGQALAVLRRRDARRARLVRWSTVLAVAAAAFLAVLAPALLRHRTSLPPAAEATATAEWESPDLDTLWEDTSVLDLDATSSSDSGSLADATLAAVSF